MIANDAVSFVKNDLKIWFLFNLSYNNIVHNIYKIRWVVLPIRPVFSVSIMLYLFSIFNCNL